MKCDQKWYTTLPGNIPLNCKIANLRNKLKRVIGILWTTVYLKTLANLDKVEQFLERYKLQKSRKTENLNRPTAVKELELVSKQLPTKKHPGPDGVTGESYTNFKKE